VLRDGSFAEPLDLLDVRGDVLAIVRVSSAEPPCPERNHIKRKWAILPEIMLPTPIDLLTSASACRAFGMVVQQLRYCPVRAPGWNSAAGLITIESRSPLMAR
jgi:hypothetical protein